MSNPVNQYAKVRRKRSNILCEIYDFLRETFQSSLNQKPRSSNLYEDSLTTKESTITKQEQSEKNRNRKSTWFEIEISRTKNEGIIESIDTDSFKIVSQTVQPTVTYTIQKCRTNYGVGNSGIWSTKQFVRGIDEILSSLEELGMRESKLANIREEATVIADFINRYEVTKSDILELILSGDIDAIESLTNVTIPQNIEELRQNSLRSYGDNFPPIPRSFIINSSQVQIEYNDDNIALLKGTTDSYDLGLLIGIDDGFAFYHPMPRSLRIDNPSYSLEHQDIRDLMSYDQEWQKGDKIHPRTWHRIQGDLLIKQIPESDITEKYQRVELCSILDEDTEKDFLLQTELWPLNGQIRFKTVTPNILPKITISYPSGPARRTIETDIRKIMGFEEDVDVGMEMVDLLIDWIIENYDVSLRAEETRKRALTQSPENRFVTQIDNHLLFVDDAHLEPEPEMIYRKFMTDDRDFTYFTVDDTSSLNIEHSEHDQTSITLEKGTYILTLARRRNQ